MPTVLRFDGLRVALYLNDHPPPHVHVLGANGGAVFVLNCPDGPLELRESFGFSGPEIRRAGTALVVNIAALCQRWEVIRGNL